MTFMASFELEGQKFNALNGGPQYKFNEAVSFFISVEAVPSVIESPNVTITLVSEGAIMSTASRKYQEAVE